MKKYLKYIMVNIVFLLIGVLLARQIFYKEQVNTKDIVNKSYNAIVSIETYKDDEMTGNGSGFIYEVDDKNAYVVTNNHVIEENDTIKVITMNGKKVKAKVMGSDVYSDIAVLSINKKYIKDSLVLGDSTKLSLGESIITISSPISQKYKGTVTKGVVSGLNRQINVDLSIGEVIIDSIQIDASTNVGSSGGAVLDLNGKVIGVIYSKLEDNSENMNFIIPISNIKSIIYELQKGNKVKRPTVGIEACNTTDLETLKNANIMTNINKEGVAVLDVYKDYPLAKAGIKKGDIIVSINDIKIINVPEFKYQLYKKNSDSKINITYYRNNQKFKTVLEI